MYRLINPEFDFVKKISDIEFTFNCGKPRLLLIRLSGQKKAASKAAFFGGCGWDRTSDPYDVNVVLIPLSYTPVNERMFTIKNFINQEFYCIYSKKLCITSCNLPFAY